MSVHLLCHCVKAYGGPSGAMVRDTNSHLQNKALFGTDHPFIRPDRWLRDFDQLDPKPEVRQKILFDKAKKVFGLR